MDIWNHEEANVGQCIYEVVWKHVYFNISVLFIVDITSILKLVFPTAYCFCPDGHLGGCAVEIVVAVVVLFYLLVYSVYFLFLFIFHLFIYLIFLLFQPLFLSLLSFLSSLLLHLLLLLVCVCVCVCVYVYTFPPWSVLSTSRRLRHTLEVRINDVMLWVLFLELLPSSFISISKYVIFQLRRTNSSLPKTERKWYDIMLREKMI